MCVVIFSYNYQIFFFAGLSSILNIVKHGEILLGHFYLRYIQKNFYVYVCGSVSLCSPVHTCAPGDQIMSGLLDMVLTSNFTHFSSRAVISESSLQLCMPIFL